jgi:hypothetical protein
MVARVKKSQKNLRYLQHVSTLSLALSLKKDIEFAICLHYAQSSRLLSGARMSFVFQVFALFGRYHSVLAQNELTVIFAGSRVIVVPSNSIRNCQQKITVIIRDAKSLLVLRRTEIDDCQLFGRLLRLLQSATSI